MIFEKIKRIYVSLLCTKNSENNERDHFLIDIHQKLFLFEYF